MTMAKLEITRDDVMNKMVLQWDQSELMRECFGWRLWRLKLGGVLIYLASKAIGCAVEVKRGE